MVNLFAFQISYIHYRHRNMKEQQPRQLNQIYSILDHKLLGKGSTGNVYLGIQHNNPSQKVAIKSIDLSQINNEVTRYLLSCEIAALSNLGKIQNTSHENIVKLMDIVFHNNHIYLIMELLQGGTLAQYIRNHPNGLDEEEALFIFRQILEGYKRIKDKQIVHRDLKPDNILFKSNAGSVKKISIIDFGYCQMMEVPNKPQVFYNVGSPKYMSPQAYKENKYSEKSDVWAMGVMLYQMLVGRTCDHGMSMEEYLELLEKRGVPIPPKIKTFFKHLLINMLNYNHQMRFECEQILRQLNQYQTSLLRHSSQIQMRPSGPSEDLRMTMDFGSNQRFAKTSPIFHSLILPQQQTIIQNERAEMLLNGRMLRSESKIMQPNENVMTDSIRRVETRGGGMSFHEEMKKSFQVPLMLSKVENVDLNSVRQIMMRKQFGEGGQPKPFPMPPPSMVKQQYILQGISPQIKVSNNNQQFVHLLKPNSPPLNYNSQPTQGYSIQANFKSVNMISSPKFETLNSTHNSPFQNNMRINTQQNLTTPKNNFQNPQVSHFQLNQPQTQQISIENLTERPELQRTASKGPHFFNVFPPNQQMVFEPQQQQIQHQQQIQQQQQQQQIHQQIHQQQIQQIQQQQIHQQIQHQMPQQIPQQQMQQQQQILQPLSHQMPLASQQQLSQLHQLQNGPSQGVRVNRQPDMTQTRIPREQRNSHQIAFTQQAFHPSPSKNLYQTVIPKRYQTEVIVPERAFQPIQRQMIQLRPQIAVSRTQNKLNYARIQPFIGRQGQAIGSMQQPHLSMLRHTIIK